MSLEKTLKDLEKLYGKNTVMKLGENSVLDIESIPTGSILLDEALGIGGIPRGRIIEIYGPESSGKSSLALHMTAEAQKMGLKCLFIDAENALNFEYAKTIGVDIDEWLINQPDYGEQALDVAERLIKTGELGLVVIDSVAALIPKQELDGEMGDSKMGLQARLMSQAMRKLVALVKKTNTTLIFINQLREKIGVSFGNPEVTTGGNALKYYASVRLDIRRKGLAIKDRDGNPIGNDIKIKVVKNKVAPPFKVVESTLYYGLGIDILGEIIDLAVEKDIVEKRGAWYKYDGTQLGQGKDQVKELFKDNPELLKEIKEKVLGEKKVIFEQKNEE